MKKLIIISIIFFMSMDTFAAEHKSAEQKSPVLQSETKARKEKGKSSDISGFCCFASPRAAAGKKQEFQEIASPTKSSPVREYGLLDIGNVDKDDDTPVTPSPFTPVTPFSTTPFKVVSLADQASDLGEEYPVNFTFIYKKETGLQTPAHGKIYGGGVHSKIVNGVKLTKTITLNLNNNILNLENIFEALKKFNSENNIVVEPTDKFDIILRNYNPYFVTREDAEDASFLELARKSELANCTFDNPVTGLGIQINPKHHLYCIIKFK